MEATGLVGRPTLYSRVPPGGGSIPLVELTRASELLCAQAYDRTRRDLVGSKVLIVFGRVAQIYPSGVHGASATVEFPVTLSLN